MGGLYNWFGGYRESLDFGGGDLKLSKGAVSTAANLYGTLVWVLKNGPFLADTDLSQRVGMVHRIPSGFQPSLVLSSGCLWAVTNLHDSTQQP